MRVPLSIRMFSLAILFFLGAFTATALAAGAVAPDDSSSIVDLMRPVYEAFAHGHYLAAGMAALVLAVALARRYAPGKAKAFMHSDIGGSLSVLVMSFAGALTTSLAGGAGVTWTMVKAAGIIAVGASGGYGMIKTLIIEPFVKPWAEGKAPAWMRPILQLVLWIFDKPTPVETAEAAGDAAVAATPATGLAGDAPVKEVE